MTKEPEEDDRARDLDFDELLALLRSWAGHRVRVQVNAISFFAWYSCRIGQVGDGPVDDPDTEFHVLRDDRTDLALDRDEFVRASLLNQCELWVDFRHAQLKMQRDD